jgi:hypothetical protein
MRTEEEYLDILQNIEAVVVSEFRDNRMLSDYNIDEVYDALIEEYRAEEIQRSARTRTFTAVVQPVYTQVRKVCEWRLGKGEGPDIAPVSLDVMIRCLRRLKKSLKKWNDRDGRQGYLEYIDNFIP